LKEKLSMETSTTNANVDQFIIRKKHSKTAPTRSCFHLKVNLGCVIGAFAYGNEKLSSEKLSSFKVQTWEKTDAYFLGILTQSEDGRMFIVNCKCVMNKFKERKNWDREWTSGENLHTCINERCSSLSCDKCFSKNRVKIVDGRYKCPFPCKTGMMYCKYNDPKKRQLIQEKVNADKKQCANCGISQADFLQKNPQCKLMVWTNVPKTKDKV
jgi:hypothetical protein